MTYKGSPIRDWIGWWIANFALAYIVSREYGDQVQAVFDQYFGTDEWRA